MLLFISFKFKWHEISFIMLLMIAAHIIAIPHLIMGKPRWYANFLNKFGQELFLFDIYKKERKVK